MSGQNDCFNMTLAHGTERLAARLVLRRITTDDLPFFTRLHALPEVAQHLYPGGRPRSAEQTAAFLQSIFESYERLALGYLAVLRDLALWPFASKGGPCTQNKVAPIDNLSEVN